MELPLALLDLIFPRKCVFCRSLLRNERKPVGFCAECEPLLPFTHNPRGKKKGEFFDFCLAPLHYRGCVRDSVLRFKFGGAVAYGKTYARLIAECVSDEPEAVFDTVTWAPVSKRRRRKRGYDQAETIARELAAILGSECRPLLAKTRDVPPQSSLSGDEKRRANISGAYSLYPGADVRGLRILLVDDIITSGATLSECSRTLLMGGAEQIICAVLARADRH